MIKQTPFACLICLVIGFAVGTWYYAGRLAVLENQVSLWKDKAASTTSSPAITVYPPSALVPANRNPEDQAHLTVNATGATFYASPDDSSLTGIVLDAQIRNSGGSSIATDWKLLVTPKGKSPSAGQFNPIPKRMQVPGNRSMTLRASEGLAEKVGNKPVPYGNVIYGILLFFVDVPLAVVEDPSTKLRLSVQDIGGHEYATEALVGDWLRPHD